MAGFVTPILASAMPLHALGQDNPLASPVKSGCRAVDDSVLDGGFRHGEVTAIAGSGGTGKTMATSEAALLDTNGFFSPLRMRDLVMARLTSNLNPVGYEQKGYVYHKVSNKHLVDDDHVREQATKVLSRIKVTRVVDLTGIIEAVHEIGETCEKAQSRSAPDFPIMQGPQPLNGARDEKGGLEIASSQDDEDEVVLDNEETIPDHSTLELVPSRSIRMLVVDNIANHASGELSSNQIGGQVLLTTCMRSLSRVTKQYTLCTILINNVVGTSRYQTLQLQEQVSAFASVPGRPALGKTFAHLLDTSILISRLPASKSDARLAMNEGKDDESVAWKNRLVLEVLYDRHGSREGRWAAFDIVNGLDLVGDVS